jgi:hypothetical protein
MGNVDEPRKELSCGHTAIGFSGSQYFTLQADGRLTLILCPICTAIVRDALFGQLVLKAVDEIAKRSLKDAKS